MVEVTKLLINCYHFPYRKFPKITFTRKTQRTQHTVIFMADLLHRNEYQVQSAKEKGTWGQVQRKTGTSFQGILLESHKIRFIPLTTSCDHTCEVLSTGEAH